METYTTHGYSISHRYMYNLECELRKVIKKSDPINYENKLTIYGTTSTVNYENIESFYILSSGDIICPRGKFHAYNNNDYTKTQFYQQILKTMEIGI